ncbi:hypothetical protein [Actinoallomurus iriomotensis]|uniref:Uncharacterized protein n=1 Tax=Actinoallomurus iriomotensis TaxID=478107 RepID=A0A9W6RDT0_9ACTN|nr:hypothetical protein [Actinoallomurus iriomotensis]GLY72070.1 hypothetical protein Airi01_003370 [Actinoallomurus iriomotensis]
MVTFGHDGARLAVLPETARGILEEIMKTRAREYKSDFARRYVAEGEAKGEARAILLLLAARGIEVPESVRVRISETTDLSLLDSWVRRAGSVESVEELLDPR